jgi:hypothetical protein
MGEAFTRHSLRPLHLEGERDQQDSGVIRRENVKSCPLARRKRSVKMILIEDARRVCVVVFALHNVMPFRSY